MGSGNGGGSKSLFNEITKGLNLAKVIVCCFSDEYMRSKNCVLEFRFAHVSLKTPIVKAIVGTGNTWRRKELSFLSGDYPEVSFQVEDFTAHDKLLTFVRAELDKVKLKRLTSAKKINTSDMEQTQADQNNAAFQEL